MPWVPPPSDHRFTMFEQFAEEMWPEPVAMELFDRVLRQLVAEPASPGPKI